MFVLKKKIQLKIAIPKNKEEEKNISLVDNNNNKSSLSKITENIYTSGYLVAKDIPFLLKNNFTHVINCSRGSSMESPNDQSSEANNYDKSPSIKYLPIFLRDDPGADIINCFFQTIDFIESKEESNKPKKILIHCIEGISRAPALISGYLMWKQNLKTQNAIDFVKSKRKCVDINLGFIIQLHKWENYLFSTPEKIHIFKLDQSIRLLEEKEFENENYSQIEHLIRFNRKLFYIKNKKNSKDENFFDEFNKLSIENSNCFNENSDKIKFISNVIKYDKSILSNDINSLIEINYDDITNSRLSFEDFLKNHNSKEH